jgi:hypothetical protein
MKPLIVVLTLILSTSSHAFFFNRGLPVDEVVLAKCGDSFHPGSIRSSFNDRESGYRYFVQFEDAVINESCRLKIYSNAITRINYGEPMAVYQPVSEYFYHNVSRRVFQLFEVGAMVDLYIDNTLISHEVLDISDKGLVLLHLNQSEGPAYYSIDELVASRILRAK